MAASILERPATSSLGRGISGGGPQNPKGFQHDRSFWLRSHSP